MVSDYLSSLSKVTTLWPLFSRGRVGPSAKWVQHGLLLITSYAGNSSPVRAIFNLNGSFSLPAYLSGGGDRYDIASQNTFKDTTHCWIKAGEKILALISCGRWVFLRILTSVSSTHCEFSAARLVWEQSDVNIWYGNTENLLFDVLSGRKPTPLPFTCRH